MKIGNLIHRFVYPKWYRENGIKYTKFDIISQVIMGIGVIGSGLICLAATTTAHPWYWLIGSSAQRFIGF